MKKSIFLFLILGGTILSCSTNSEEYERAAKKICSCMKAGEAGAEDANLSIGFCLLDTEVDLKEPEMKKQMNKQCPQFNDGFEDFVKELK
ncbi:MAG: hypothetical protein AB8B56_18370 [Crocinitomicaceae bacterium]